MPEDNGPLLILARRLLSYGPPSLTILINRLEGAEEYEGFIKVVEEFFPEYKAEILGGISPDAQMGAFACRFEDRYFPLSDNFGEMEDDSYHEFNQGIPIILRGISYDEYDYIVADSRPGVQLMTLLIEDPYNADGTHAPLAEACLQHVPADIIRRAPEGGLLISEAHRIFDKTPYEALAIWGDIVSQDTGNYFLDYDWEMVGGQLPGWTMENVVALTQEWHQADLLSGKVDKLIDWLEEDSAARFEELVNFIEERRRDGSNKDGSPKQRTEGLPVGSTGRD